MFVLNRWWTSASARLERRVAQVREHRRDLSRRQHALVGEGARRQADDEEQRSLGEPQRVGIRLDALARDVELSLEMSGSRRCAPSGARAPRRHADEDLLEDRLRRAGPCAQLGVVGRHVPPAEQLQTFLFADAREQRLHLRALGRVLRQENQAGAVVARRRAARIRAAAGRGRTRPASAIRMPAPSPVFASQPQAPRCSRLISSFSPCSTMACERRPLRWTTKPTPHASFSKRGS